MEADPSIQRLLNYLVFGSPIERQPSPQQQEQDDAQAPDVHCLGVALALEHLQWFVCMWFMCMMYGM